MDDTAATAPDGQTPAGTTVTEDSANSLDTDMSDDELLAFVDKTIGPQPTVKNSFGNSEALPTPNEIAAGAVATDDDKPKDAPKPPDAEEKPADKPVELPKPPQQTEEIEPEVPATPESVDTSDLWIEVQGIEVDAEGKQTERTYRITLDDGIPDDIRFRDDKQLAEVLDALNEMRDIRNQRQAEYDENLQKAEQSETQQNNQQQLARQWDQEIVDLQTAGLLDKQLAPPKDPKGYSAEEVAADPALQRIDNIFTFMAEENNRRSGEGKPLLASFASAFNLYQRQESQIEEQKRAQQEDEAVKRKGAMVGGGAGGSAKTGKGYVYKAGSAKSIYSVDTSDL